MSHFRKRIAAGNWKMHGDASGLETLRQIAAIDAGDVETLICPPSTLISRAATIAKDSTLSIGGQDCHASETGAHTGDISAEMLKDAGADYVILGHSERRTDYNESSDDVREKTRAAWRAGLTAIVCVGETLEQREAVNTLDIVGGQMAASVPDLATGENLIIAYEPVWAIGTGLVPTLDQIGEVHDFIRSRLERRFGEGVGRSVRVLYGGSMKPSNAGEIITVSNVDGGLIGGASLKVDDFAGIVAAMQPS